MRLISFRNLVGSIPIDLLKVAENVSGVANPRLVGERLYLYVVIGFREDVAGFVDAARVDVLRKRHSAVLVDRSRQIGAVRFESVGDLIDGDIGSPIDFFRSHQFLEFRKQRLPLFVRKRGDGIFPASLRLAVQAP